MGFHLPVSLLLVSTEVRHLKIVETEKRRRNLTTNTPETETTIMGYNPKYWVRTAPRGKMGDYLTSFCSVLQVS